MSRHRPRGAGRAGRWSTSWPRAGILIRSPSLRGVAEEAPGAYKDVAAVVDAAERAGLARKVVRARAGRLHQGIVPRLNRLRRPAIWAHERRAPRRELSPGGDGAKRQGRATERKDFAVNEPVHVVCPRCNTTNRVQRERLDGGARCGSCGEALLPAQPFELNAEGFDRQWHRTICRWWWTSGRRGAGRAG